MWPMDFFDSDISEGVGSGIRGLVAFLVLDAVRRLLIG